MSWKTIMCRESIIAPKRENSANQARTPNQGVPVMVEALESRMMMSTSQTTSPPATTPTTPNLFKSCCTGTHIPAVVIS